RHLFSDHLAARRTAATRVRTASRSHHLSRPSTLMALTRKRVMMTGGAGFLDSHLCERLLRNNHDVLCVDNYFTGRKDNIAQLLSDPQFEAMRHDITFPLYVEVDEI